MTKRGTPKKSPLPDSPLFARGATLGGGGGGGGQGKHRRPKTCGTGSSAWETGDYGPPSHTNPGAFKCLPGPWPSVFSVTGGGGRGGGRGDAGLTHALSTPRHPWASSHPLPLPALAFGVCCHRPQPSPRLPLQPCKGARRPCSVFPFPFPITIWYPPRSQGTEAHRKQSFGPGRRHADRHQNRFTTKQGCSH